MRLPPSSPGLSPARPRPGPLPHSAQPPGLGAPPAGSLGARSTPGPATSLQLGLGTPGSLHLLLCSQGPLAFAGLCSASSAPSFSVFCLLSAVLGGRINQVPATPFWPEVETWRFLSFSWGFSRERTECVCSFRHIEPEALLQREAVELLLTEAHGP